MSEDWDMMPVVGPMPGGVRCCRISMLTGDVNTMDLPTTIGKLTKWREALRVGSAPLIQDEFPELNADQREFLLTGITPEEWHH